MIKSDIKKKITENICEAIILSGKTKKQIAAETGISKPTLSQYLSGRSMPGLITFKILCDVLDCSPEDILVF